MSLRFISSLLFGAPCRRRVRRSHGEQYKRRAKRAAGENRFGIAGVAPRRSFTPHAVCQNVTASEKERSLWRDHFEG
jgi:hypothetical protein